MLGSLFMFLWRTFAFTTTTVMGVSAAFYIGNFLTKSMIRDSSENVDSDDEVESVEDEFECRYDIDFKALDKKVAPPKKIVKNYVSTVDTPIGDVVMTYDVDSDTFIYYSERRTIPIRFLDTVCKKFVIEHDCKVFYKEENVEVEEENGGLGQAPEAQLSNEVALSPQEDDESLPPLPPASRKEEEKEKQEVGTGLWIQQFMQNKNYNIVDNEGGGDCLFAVIRDAFSQIGKTYTVGDLRKLLSDAVTEDVFMNYYQLYTEISVSIATDKQRLKEIVAENNILREKLPLTRDSREQKVIVQQAKKLKEEFERIKREQHVSTNMLEEYKFMNGVKSLQQFRAVINTCRFWGDTWAITTLERALNTKFILLSEENFEEGDLDNVLQCGQLNDDELESSGTFTPDYYITMDYNGWHYKLITYKEHGIFTYDQLPYAIRDLIVNKCLERLSGPYALIPEFVDARLTDKSDANVVLEVMESDPKTVFTFYGRSNAKPLPGKGSGEKIPKERQSEFRQLATISDWRKKLSNEWIASFDIDGHQWQSVEHYYQGNKYKQSNPEIYYQFTLDSRSELGKSIERAKKFKDVEPDMDFAGKRGKEILYRGLEAKFVQHPELKQVLLATKDATLQIYRPRTEPTKAVELMRLRKNLM